FVDTSISEQWDRFILTIKGPCKEQRVPLMIGELKEYISRPAEVEAVISKLLDDKREEPIAITAALKGAGGFGKTTLARAVCHDERIQQAFDDGILWVTLGEKVENLFEKLDTLIYGLTGKKSDAPTLEAAIIKLDELLEDHD